MGDQKLLMGIVSPHGPQWDYLSENLQANLMRYIFSAGVRPEIGLCVEYLSWNKEQRLYMGWMRDLYTHLFAKTGNQYAARQRIQTESDAFSKRSEV